MNKLQRRWSEEQPVAYDKETQLVCFDVQPEKRVEGDKEVEGFSFYQVEIDRVIDYGHIKSQLIEAGYAQKDEFGLLMNAMDDLLTAIASSSSFDELKKGISTDDLTLFAKFCAYRDLCAQTAKEVIKAYE